MTNAAAPYAYERAGFGNFIGFNSAWLGTVSYVVLIFGGFGCPDGDHWRRVVPSPQSIDIPDTNALRVCWI